MRSQPGPVIVASYTPTNRWISGGSSVEKWLKSLEGSFMRVSSIWDVSNHARNFTKS